MKIIDTHTHFYDPFRPQGVSWPSKNDLLLYRSNLPNDYRSQRVPQVVAGTVVVECSPWVEDNQWVLDIAAKNPFIVGFVGNLHVGTPEFAKHLKRFAVNPIFRGIRIKHAILKNGLEQRAFVSDLRLLATNDLELDLYGGPVLLTELSKLAELVPELRVVINHMANVKISGQEMDSSWRDGIRAAAAHQNVFCKVSGLVEGTGCDDGNAPRDAMFYRAVLDVVWDSFGEDRVIYGSNWPVCQRFSTLACVQAIVTDYFTGKGAGVAEKFFSKNASTIYRCK